MLSFKWRHFEKEIILLNVRWYLAYPLSYRNLEEIAEERGYHVDHSTLNRWVITHAPKLEQARHATSRNSGTPVTNIHSPTQRMGDALVALRPSQLLTKPCSVKTTSNGWTAIRNAILASLARY